MILLIDNYDSFTYNLVQYFQILKQTVCVYKNDQITLADIEKLAPNHLVISPGPNGPVEAGVSVAAVQYFCHKLPILGVCLGHQCLGYAFGASIIQATEIMHGKTSMIYHRQKRLFTKLSNPFRVARYHSLVIEPQSLPDSFTVDAWVDDIIMAISHQQLPLFGLQFHPEAILSEHGLILLKRFINQKSQQNFTG